MYKRQYKNIKLPEEKEGGYAKAIETTRNLIHLGLSRENIVKTTGLSIEEIEKL